MNVAQLLQNIEALLRQAGLEAKDVTVYVNDQDGPALAELVELSLANVGTPIEPTLQLIIHSEDAE